MTPRLNFALNKFCVKGFSLLDLQVASVVLSFGILGLTEAMVGSFDQSNEGLNRTLAVLESKNLLQRMRSHQSSLGEFGDFYANVAFQQPAETTTSCLHRACSASAQADFDVALWQCALIGGGLEFNDCESLRLPHLNAGQIFFQLPEGRLALTLNGGSGAPARLLTQIRWQGLGTREQTLDFGVR